MKLYIKSISDFQRHRLINAWFWRLRLLEVCYSPCKPKVIKNVLCRVVCDRGHEALMPWVKLQQGTVCRECKTIDGTATSFSTLALLRKVIALEPERRRLFDVLFESRRRAAGQEDTTLKDLIVDTLAYVRGVRDPVKELAEMSDVYERCDYGVSSLVGPALMYVGVE